MSDARRYAVWSDPRSSSRSWAFRIWKSGHFQKLSPPPFTKGAGNWPCQLRRVNRQSRTGLIYRCLVFKVLITQCACCNGSRMDWRRYIWPLRKVTSASWMNWFDEVLLSMLPLRYAFIFAFSYDIIIHAVGRRGVRFFTGVCLFVSFARYLKSKTTAARITQLDTEMLHRESRIPTYFGAGTSKVKLTRPGKLRRCGFCIPVSAGLLVRWPLLAESVT